MVILTKLQKTTPLAKKFIELLGRSNFSFLQGASHPEEMVEQAIKYDYDGIALCDLNGLYGVARGYATAHSPSMFTASMKGKEGFHYLIGSEITLVDEGSLTLIPKNKNGYAHLCELLTLGKRQAAKGFSSLSLEQVKKYSEDLLCLALPPFDATPASTAIKYSDSQTSLTNISIENSESRKQFPIQKSDEKNKDSIRDYKKSNSENRFQKLESIFGDRLYIPVWRDLTWESQEYCKQAFLLEEKYGAQLFVTQRPFMHTPDRKPLFDVLTCILHHTTLEESKTKLIQNAERTLKSIEDISLLWQDRLDLVEKTVDIAQRSNFSLSEIRYCYPRSHIPDNLTPAEYLRKLTEQGARWRFPDGVPDKVSAAIEKELSLIKTLQYEDYFITLKEICQFAQDKSILFQGRGSAANSVVCFCLGLTSVNPTEIDLLFERFMSLERREPPDIDIDFEHSRREEVIQYIYEKYDERHAAMVCTVIRFRSRMAIRETAKVFGIPLPKINAMIKFMGRDGMKRLLEDPSVIERFGLARPQWDLFLNMSQQLNGFPRHLGIHTGGFLITQDSITEMVPIEKATMNGRYVIQWNKDDVAALGLMKIDVLSLGMLTCLRKSFELLQKHKDITFNLATIPANDKATYDMICRAETVGVFQIESRAQMNTLPRMKPRKFYDLVIEVALVRPGPLQGGMVHPYLKRRQGLEKVTYPSELLRPILEKTHGVPIFQEQVMRIVIQAADFTPGEADELRRIMSSAWRKRTTMEAIHERIITGFHKNGIAPEYGEQIYNTIQGFSNYGFPESHAASFALLTYASCFLKCHHPDVFACSLLNSQPMGFYAPRTIIAEAQKNNVEVRPLSVQHSDYDYTLEKNSADAERHSLRVGLRSLYGVPEKVARVIESNRKEQGPYTDLTNFVRRTALPRSLLIKLAAAGAMECFHLNARELIWHLESISLDQNSFLWGQPKEFLTKSQNLEDENELMNSEDTFSEYDVQLYNRSRNQIQLTLEHEAETLPFESHWDRLRREYDTKGFSVDSHPLSVLRTYLRAKNQELIKNKYVPFMTSEDLQKIPHKRKVRVAGLVSVTQRPPTAKGMCFITLEDEFGFINVVIHPDVYQKDRLSIYGRSLLEIQGQVEKASGLINVRAARVLPLT